MLLVLYGSQTGNAEEIATRLSKFCGDDVELLAMNEWLARQKAGTDVSPLAVSRRVLFVVSTTGNGDFPDNASKFWRKLKRYKQDDWLKDVTYGLLGLGSTDYDNFCGPAKQLDAYLKKHGAQPFISTEFADDATGLETKVEPFIEQFEIFCKNQKNPVKTKPKLKLRISRDRVNKALNNGIDIEDITHISSPSLKEINLDKGDIPWRWQPSESNDSFLHGITPETPFWSRLIACRYLTNNPRSDRQVVHMEFALPFNGDQESVAYYPGDAVGVYFTNPLHLVERLLKRLDLVGDRVIKISSSGTPTQRPSHLPPVVKLTDLFLHCVEISLVTKKSLVRLLAQSCGEDKEQTEYLMHLVSDQGKECFDREILDAKVSLLDLLERFSSCKPELSKLIYELRPLQPRYYSISSSPSVYPQSIHIAFTLVRYETQIYSRTKPGETDESHTTTKFGVCSSWLHDLAVHFGYLTQPETSERALNRIIENGGIGCQKRDGRPFIPIFFRRGKEFTLPRDTLKPLILIGPGTGVAPFRGFLQHRQQDRVALRSGGSAFGEWRGMDMGLSSGTAELDDDGHAVEEAGQTQTMLLFGCRHRDEDFLYREDLEQFVEDGTLTLLEVAFSREQTEKVYVQHKLRQRSEMIVDWIFNKSAYVFVCGDGSQMARDVYRMFCTVLVETGTFETLEQATEYIKGMIESRRYIQDIWTN